MIFECLKIWCYKYHSFCHSHLRCCLLKVLFETSFSEIGEIIMALSWNLIFFCLKDRGNGRVRERGRERSSICWFTCQMPISAMAGQAEANIQEPLVDILLEWWRLKCLSDNLLSSRVHISRKLDQKQKWDLLPGTLMWDLDMTKRWLNPLCHNTFPRNFLFNSHQADVEH